MEIIHHQSSMKVIPSTLTKNSLIIAMESLSQLTGQALIEKKTIMLRADLSLNNRYKVIS